MRESIIKFDELLSLKCNKSALVAFKQDLGLDFLSIIEMDNIDDKIDRVRDMHTNLENRVDMEIEEYKKKIGDITQIAINSQLDAKFKKYSEVAKSFE